MKRNTIILAGVALAAGALWAAKRGNTHGGADAQRMAGMRDLYASNAGQMAGVDAAIREQWRQLDSVFTTQPDFYI